MHIIQIHSTDGGGGLVAYHLMDGLCKYGHDSELLVGSVKLSHDTRVKYLTRKGHITSQLANLFPLPRKCKTAYNWKKRSEIYKNCKLYVTAPSKWILDAAHQSILNAGIVDSAVIPNGIDLDVFCPVDKY